MQIPRDRHHIVVDAKMENKLSLEARVRERHYISLPKFAHQGDRHIVKTEKEQIKVLSHAAKLE